MKTIGYGLIQIPIVRQYKVCCIERTLAGGVTSTGWQQIIGGLIRITLLSSWGLQSIDHSLPQTAEKMIGVYIEFFILGFLVANGILTLFGLWSNNLFLLYPSVGVIPLCFLADIIVKGTCYATLFLTPKVTSFGILSLIEVWFRGLSLMYGWIITISYIYYKRKECEPAKVEVELNARSPGRASTIVRRNSSRTPFSRNSSLSQRGRHSFLLRKSSKKESNGKIKAADEEQCDERDMTCDIQHFNLDDALVNYSVHGLSEDGESDILLGESATMSMKRNPPSRGAANKIAHGDQQELASNSQKDIRPPPSKYKKIGGFVPSVLRMPSGGENSEKSDRSGVRPKLHLNTQCDSIRSADTTELCAPFLQQGSTIHYDSNSPNKQYKSIKLSTEQTPNLLSSPQPQLHCEPPSRPRRPPVGSITKEPNDAVAWEWISSDYKPKGPTLQASCTSVSHLRKHISDPVLV